MTPSAKLATLFATGTLLLAGSPAFADSAMTDAFVANVRPNVDFLDSSSRLALDNSDSPRVRSFARREATEQTITSNSLVAWTQTNAPSMNAPPMTVGALADPLAPVADIAAAPLDLAAGVTDGVVGGVGSLVTGRSVAIDQSTPGGRMPLAAEQTDIARLHDLRGGQFDVLYRSTQEDALHQLAVLYRDYIADGDDPALRNLAIRELPKINRRIAELRRL